MKRNFCGQLRYNGAPIPLNHATYQQPHYSKAPSVLSCLSVLLKHFFSRVLFDSGVKHPHCRFMGLCPLFKIYTAAPQLDNFVLAPNLLCFPSDSRHSFNLSGSMRLQIFLGRGKQTVSPSMAHTHSRPLWPDNRLSTTGPQDV